MNKILSLMIVSFLVLPVVAGDLTDFEDRGHVEDSLEIDLPEGTVGFGEAYLIGLPIEDHTWETVTLETGALQPPTAFWDVDVSPNEAIFFSGTASLDVSSLAPAQYALFVYTCNTGGTPDCGWMKPQVFTLVVPGDELETAITSPPADTWHSDDLALAIDETNVPSLDCGYSLDTNGDGSADETGDRTCDEPFDITVGSGETCSSQGSGMCSVEIDITNSEGTTETASAAFNIDYTDPTVDLSLDPAGSTVSASVDASSSYSPVTECSIDWQNDSPYDLTESFNDQDVSFSESHTYSTGGEKTVLANCTDAAGNFASTTATVTVVGDFSTSIDDPAETSWHQDSFTASVTDDYDVSDVTCEYRLDYDGSSWDTSWQTRTCSETIEIEAGPGTDCDTQGQDKCRLQTRLSDDDGHVATDLRAFNIDYEDPPVDLVLDGADTTVDAEISAGPTHSRISTCRIDWQNDPPYDESWDVNSQVTTTTRSHDYGTAGTYTVLANCTDQAGNSATNTESISVPLDADLSTSINGPSDDWHRTSFDLDISDSGTAAGLTCEYRIDDGDDGSWDTGWQTRTCDEDQQITVGSSAQCSTQGDDSCRIQVRSQDANGNGDTATTTVSIDYTQPDVSVTPDPTSEMAIGAGIQAESDHSPITECKVDWQNDPPFDVTRTFDTGSVSTTESHTYTTEGTHTILLRCQDKAGNSRDATGDVNLPYEEPLDYTLIDDPVDGTITDQDAFTAAIEAETNAETILWEMNGESYELTHDGGNIYNTLIDISDLTGTYDVSLVFQKDGEELTEAPYKTITFADTPPQPGLSIETLDGNAGIEASVTTNYDTATEVTLDLSIDDTDGNERYSDSKTITCDDSCSTTFDEPVSDGETVTVSATQSAFELTSAERTRTVTVAAAPEIHDIDFIGPVGTEVASTGYWRAGIIGIMASGFTYGDINSVRLVDESDEVIGTTVTNDILNASSDFLIDFLEIDTSEGNGIVGFNASLEPDEITGEEETLDFEVNLEDGTTLTHEFATIEKIASPPAPSIDEISFSGALADEVNVTLELSDPYHEHFSYEIRDTNGDVVADEDNILIKDGDGSTKATITSLPSSDGMAEIEVMVENPAGESTTETTEALLDPDALLEPFEINGDPQEKINMILYGHRYSMTELENTVAPEAVDFFFESGDLADVHGPYRDHFNWYLIDTDEELCPYDVEENDCDFLQDNIPTFESGDTIKGGNAGIAVLSDQGFRSWAWSSDGFSLTSFGDGSTFAHELGHQVWGYDDEYNGGNGQYWGRTINLFPAHDSYDKDRYPNTWPNEEACQDAVEANYTSLSPSDCDEIIGSEPIWRIRAGDGPSLMEASSDPAEYYKTHEKRVEYLMDNNPYYSGE